MINTCYPLSEVDSSEYENLKIKGMKFDIKGYEAKGLGHVSTMKASGMAGLMKMDTLIITPLEKDLPLFSYDRIKAMGNDILITEMYDTLLGELDLSSFDELKASYPDYPKYVAGERWYDSIRFSQSIGFKGKKKNAGEFDNIGTDYLSAFLALPAAEVTDLAAKEKASTVYVEGLINNGGAAADEFLKKLGKDKTRELFKNVIFGC